jgi:hypothetical protein
MNYIQTMWKSITEAVTKFVIFYNTMPTELMICVSLL